MSGIVAKDIKVTLSGNPILKGVSLTINQGDFVGIIGPNGSGKSTFLKCLYRTLQPNHGAISLDHEDLKSMNHKKSARKMSVVGQHNDLQFAFTVLEMVYMGRSPYKSFMERDTKEDFDLVKSSLEKVSMWSFRDRYYNTLSGGEKQRVILARALAQETDYLILDEPTNHLDIKHQLEFMDLAQSMDKTVIVAVHDLSIALKYCNKIGVLKDGHLIDFGLVKDVLTPEAIESLYGVEVVVVEDLFGKSHVQYLGVVKD